MIESTILLKLLGHHHYSFVLEKIRVHVSDRTVNLIEFSLFFSVPPGIIRTCLVGPRKTPINLTQTLCFEDDI
jgi:hypothetical protein